ncbi:MAG: hypothetical protein NTX45_15075 [Proteobacteria bacterium]|nr:hypothetical protein [Pseudomonadota bacterium]
MKTLQLTAHVSADGMLHIPAPDFAGQEIDVVVVLAPRRMDQSNPTPKTAGEATLVFSSMESNGRILYFNPPLVFTPYRDEGDGELLMVTDEDLGLHVYAPTRSQLADDLTAELFFLWDEYAQEPDENLTPKAQLLKSKLLERCREHHSHAA